ncbi:protein of unknown function [Saccharicrinis carchari]|uniref:DUF5077 domain-containing protein n=1 Tax=Saccharicrinis carchari TaxID=1168039 RepID=A0A521BYW1_SACCC|nr:DUF3472 domain-containing protein [Saccharicrinis carchari]SMO52245.1 protein of unknown function [Saccharicrinis carchari]
MNRKKSHGSWQYLTSVMLLLLFFSCSNATKNVDYSESVPLGGNAWVINNKDANRQMINKEGLVNWTNPDDIVRTYFRIGKTGKLNIGIEGKVVSGKSTMKVTFNGHEKEISLADTDTAVVHLGAFNVDKPGYYYVDIQGTIKTGDSFGEISHVLLGGDAVSEEVYYVKDDFYWGRRGPSVHLTYQVPDEVNNVKWFYNEITVPEGEDVMGSYFMANGFGEGYFGIQVNSPTERRILFSVWSPFKTDNPNEIPEEERILMLKKGVDVHTGKFGNEGSGGQSYKVFNWKAGISYQFLLKGHPSVNNSTDYTAYFFDPEKAKWELIASFRRPKTTSYLKRPHSFLENFITAMGTESRKAYYTNQWVADENGNWYELTEAKFTADATAHKEARLDYAGGVEGDAFFMKNCGFFSDHVPFNQMFKREKTNAKPVVDFLALPEK